MLLFVYGSLMTGMQNHSLLSTSSLLGAGRSAEGYGLISLNEFPGLIHVQTGLRVTGEVWEIDADTLDRLDIFETAMYHREPIEVLCGEHGVVQAQAYLLTHPERHRNAEVFPCWRTYVESRKTGMWVRNFYSIGERLRHRDIKSRSR